MLTATADDGCFALDLLLAVLRVDIVRKTVCTTRFHKQMPWIAHEHSGRSNIKVICIYRMY